MPSTMLEFSEEFSKLKVCRSSLNEKMLTAFHPKHLVSGRLGDAFEGRIFEEKP